MVCAQVYLEYPILEYDGSAFHGVGGLFVLG